jgi:crotonobetainyl-CoA:carnitine CoA-transferase CaiB-like acyl-CoA transferase
MAAGALQGLRVFDLTRILAGPSCTQILGDLGAEVIKVEQPGRGDDTRGWGPPFLKDVDGEDTTESAYFMGANRNKRSLTLDIASDEGAALARRLIARCDILVENFKVGGLTKYGLGWDDLREEYPRLIYCSITGFGQDGPYASRAGYDFMIQGMGGVMSVTGEPDGVPMKVGIPISDLMAGMYATVSILAALRHRDCTGDGQRLDISLFDSQVGWLYNQGMNYLIGNQSSPRHGNGHPNVAPCDAYDTSDGTITIVVGNNTQFRSLCELIGRPKLADEERFINNGQRHRNRAELDDILRPAIKRKSSREWLDLLADAKVAAGPINTIAEIFADPQVAHRGMRIALPHAAAGGAEVPFIASPMRLSETPPGYRYGSPMLGQHSDEILREVLDLDAAEIEGLRARGTI